MLQAFTAACHAFCAFVRWKLATDLDNCEDELDILAKKYTSANRPSADDELRILRLRQRIDRKKHERSSLQSALDKIEKG